MIVDRLLPVALMTLSVCSSGHAFVVTANSGRTRTTSMSASSARPPMPHRQQQQPLFALPKHIGNTLASCALAGLTLFSNPSFCPPAHADGSTVVGSIKGSGLLFKDTLQIESFDDPKVKGVKLYISNFQIPVTERFSKGQFFSDPSTASISCARNKQISIADTVAKGPSGEEVFEESKSLLFKTLRVQRIYDEESNTMIYVSFNTRLDKESDDNKSRFKSSICAINLD